MIFTYNYDNKTYVIRGDKYWIINNKNILDGYPQKLNIKFMRSLLNKNIYYIYKWKNKELTYQEKALSYLLVCVYEIMPTFAYVVLL